jgi:hypothetical protein
MNSTKQLTRPAGLRITSNLSGEAEISDEKDKLEPRQD